MKIARGLPMQQIELICSDCLKGMNKLEPRSVDLVVTSPPYFCGKEYEDKYKTLYGYELYVNFLLDVFDKVYWLLKPGGHLWINIDDSHTSVKSEFKKSVVLPTHALLISHLYTYYDYKELVLWRKIRSHHASGGARRLLGSYGRFCSPGAIPIIGECEYVLWFKKPGKRTDVTDEMRKASALTKQEFIDYGRQIWEIAPARAKKIGHPAPFPVELVTRIIKLSTFVNDLVLDPFIGSGTTALACLQTNRRCIGFDKEAKYIELAEQRIKEWQENNVQTS